MKEKTSILKELRIALLDKLKESLVSVFPVTLLVFLLAMTPWVDITPRELTVFGLSALFLILGISLFNLGADMAMTPMGQYVGEGLTKSKKLGILLSVSFVMGLFITIAEPDLTVLASQVSAVMNGTVLIYTVGCGVGIMLLLGVVKILFHLDLTNILMFGYMLLFCLAAILIDRGKGSLMAMSFDSGGVASGPMTSTFILPFAVGACTALGDSRPGAQGRRACSGAPRPSSGTCPSGWPRPCAAWPRAVRAGLLQGGAAGSDPAGSPGLAGRARPQPSPALPSAIRFCRSCA